MNDRPKYPRADALKVAELIKHTLAPCCQLIEIAGSLRREKPEVSDIEIVYVPKIESRRVDFFSSEQFDLCNEEIGRLLASGFITKRPNEAGSFVWGKLNKLAIHRASGIPLDLFCEPEILDWPRSLTIRTGSKEFNIELMATAPKVGLIPHAYGHSLNKANGERVFAESERDFIEKCGVKWREPRDR